MALKFLQANPETILEKIKTDLSHIDSSVDMAVYESMGILALKNELPKLDEAVAAYRKTSRYGSWLKDEGFVRDQLVAEAARMIYDAKKAAVMESRLVPGQTYYRDVSRFGDKITGHKCVYGGTRFTGWMPFTESAAVAKAMTLIRFGSEEDFREIYVGMADGRSDALNEMAFGHITESSTSALSDIEAYCDARWDGPWPWEIEAPEKLKMFIERREEKIVKTTAELQREASALLREFANSEMDNFELISAGQEMISKTDAMIADMGKISSTGIQMLAQAKAAGDDSMVAPMQNALGEPLNAAIAAMTDLKAALTKATTGEDVGGPDMGGDMGGDMGDDLGSPADAMGDMPGGDMSGDLSSDDLADIDLSGDGEERPMKDA